MGIFMLDNSVKETDTLWIFHEYHVTCTYLRRAGVCSSLRCRKQLLLAWWCLSVCRN